MSNSKINEKKINKSTNNEQLDRIKLKSLLNKLPVRECIKHGWLGNIIQIACCVDLNFTDELVSWLSPVYGNEHGRKRVDEVMRNMDRPCCIEKFIDDDACNDIVLNVYEVGKVKARDPAHCPCITVDGDQTGFTRGTIMLNDEIQLRGVVNAGKGWWKVVEIRSNKCSLLVVQYKQQKINNSQNNGNNNTNNIKPRNPIPEYKEIGHMQFLGCTVKRTGPFPSEELFDDEEVAHRPAVEYYFQLPNPDSGKALASLRNLVEDAITVFGDLGETTEDKNNQKGNRKDTKMANKISMGKGKINKTRNLIDKKNNKVDSSNRAQLEVWSAEKSEIVRARAILGRIDPYAVTGDHRQWCLVARALKSVCRGGDQLLGDFIRWSIAGGFTDGHEDDDEDDFPITQTVESSCRKVWRSQRPYSNCDEASITKARAYLRAHGMDNMHDFFDEDGRILTLEEVKAAQKEKRAKGGAKLDPLGVKVFNAARETLMNAVLKFYDRKVEIKNSSSSNSSSSTPLVLKVPCVLNEWNLTEPTSTVPGSTVYNTPEYDAVGVEVLNDHIIQQSNVDSTIKIGDALYLEESSGHHSWAVVKNVDLLFGRIRVHSQGKVPQCFSLSTTDAAGIDVGPRAGEPGGGPADGRWIHVSRLWNTLVSRKISVESRIIQEVQPPSKSSTTGIDEIQEQREVDVSIQNVVTKEIKILRYLTFVTPIPSPSSVLSFLSSLPRVQSRDEKSAFNKKHLINEADRAQLQVRVLKTASNAVIIGWSKESSGNEKKNKNKNKNNSIGAVAVVVCPCVYRSDQPMPWTEVYRGRDSACQISPLTPATSYHVKVVALTNIALPLHLQGSGPRVSAYIMATTLAAQPTHAPSVVEWGNGQGDRSVRLVLALGGCKSDGVDFFDRNSRLAASLASGLPEGCSFMVEAAKATIASNISPLTGEHVPWPDQIERERAENQQLDDQNAAGGHGHSKSIVRSLSIDNSISNALHKRHTDADADSGPGSGSEGGSTSKWRCVAHGRSPYLLCVGPWAGADIAIRYRVINNNHEASPPSPELHLRLPQY